MHAIADIENVRQTTMQQKKGPCEKCKTLQEKSKEMDKIIEELTEENLLQVIEINTLSDCKKAEVHLRDNKTHLPTKFQDTGIHEQK